MDHNEITDEEVEKEREKEEGKEKEEEKEKKEMEDTTGDKERWIEIELEKRNKWERLLVKGKSPTESEVSSLVEHLAAVKSLASELCLASVVRAAAAKNQASTESLASQLIRDIIGLETRKKRMDSEWRRPFIVAGKSGQGYAGETMMRQEGGGGENGAPGCHGGDDGSGSCKKAASYGYQDNDDEVTRRKERGWERGVGECGNCAIGAEQCDCGIRKNSLVTGSTKEEQEEEEREEEEEEEEKEDVKCLMMIRRKGDCNKVGCEIQIHPENVDKSIKNRREKKEKGEKRKSRVGVNETQTHHRIIKDIDETIAITKTTMTTTTKERREAGKKAEHQSQHPEYNESFRRAEDNSGKTDALKMEDDQLPARAEDRHRFELQKTLIETLNRWKEERDTIARRRNDSEGKREILDTTLLKVRNGNSEKWYS